MKIAVLNTLYAPYQVGGAERSTQLLAEGLTQRGHSVCVITLGGPSVPERSVLNGVTVHRVPLENWYWPYSGTPGRAIARAAWHVRDFHNRAMSARVATLLERERPDVLSTHSLAGFSVGVWSAARARRIPVVHTLRDYYLMCPPGAMYRKAANCDGICARCLPFAAYRRRASESVQAVAGISRFILERHRHAGFFPRGTAKVIVNPLPAAQAPARERRARGLVYGFIGRIAPEKGLEWLLQAFAASGPADSRLIVAGGGEAAYVASLQRRLASPRVTFLGHVNPAAFYEQVDVAVVPSLWHEPFGRTAIEPLAYGIPVIASRRGGLAEVVEDGTTGLVVDPDEPGSLACAIGRFSADPSLGRTLGENGKRRLAQFSQQAVTDVYAAVFADISCR